jgi:transcriptional regulator
MFLPEVFRGKSEHALRLLAENPLVTLVVHGSGAPEIANAPMIATRDDRLLGHIATRNPMLADIERGARVTAIVRGPDGYVSPRTYVSDDGHVPTWNYAAAHVVGCFRRADDDVKSLDELVLAFEGQGGWSPDWSDKRLGDLASHIACFEIVIESVAVKLKLGQNRQLRDFEASVDAFERKGASDLVRWMRRISVTGD